MRPNFMVRLQCKICGFVNDYHNLTAQSLEVKHLPYGSPDWIVYGIRKIFSCLNCESEIEWEGGFEPVEAKK